jgi:hypothetical protein
MLEYELRSALFARNRSVKDSPVARLCKRGAGAGIRATSNGIVKIFDVADCERFPNLACRKEARADGGAPTNGHSIFRSGVAAWNGSMTITSSAWASPALNAAKAFSLPAIATTKSLISFPTENVSNLGTASMSSMMIVSCRALERYSTTPSLVGRKSATGPLPRTLSNSEIAPEAAGLIRGRANRTRITPSERAGACCRASSV